MNTFTMTKFSMATLLILSGCSGAADVVSTSEDTGAAPSRVTGSDSPAPAPISIQGVTNDADGVALGGVRVCLQAGATIAMDIGTCATSEADGSFLLNDIPRDLLLTIGFAKPGYMPMIRAIRTEATDVELPADESIMRPLTTPPAFGGAPFDARTGAMEFFVGSDGEAPLASVWIVSYDNPNANYEPVYLDANRDPAIGATAGSFGAFVGLPPGLYLVTFHSETGSCARIGSTYGYPVDFIQVPGQTSILVPVVEGHVTAPVGVACDGSAIPVGR